MAPKRGKPKDVSPRPAPRPAAPRATGAHRGGGSAWPLVGTAGRGVLALGVVLAVMAAVIWVGGRAGHTVAPRDRYTVPFADIRCPAPPGTDRLRFLTEVRYLGNVPETVQVVDPTLPERLPAAFARHPWVAAVGAVTVRPEGSIEVALTFRVPVLAVEVIGDNELHQVDRYGVILPGPPAGQALAKLVPAQPPPQESPGLVWANPVVRRAADLANTYRPTRIAKTAKGWEWTLPDGRVQTALY